MGSIEQKIKLWTGLHSFLEALEENPVIFQAQETKYIPLFMAPNLCLQS